MFSCSRYNSELNELDRTIPLLLLETTLRLTSLLEVLLETAVEITSSTTKL